MKRIVGILVLLISVLSVYAQSANIEKIWVDHNAYENNKSGMRIHVKFDVSGLRNQEIYVSASFYDEKKENPIKCYSDGYKTSSNTMVSYCYSTPRYENSTYNDFQLFMPYYVFDNSNMKSGTYHYYVAINIVSNWKQIATSNWQFFTYTRRNNNIANGFSYTYNGNTASNNNSNQSNEALFNKGVELFKVEKYSEAIPYFEKIANQGYVDAQFNIGFCYFRLKDYKNAISWLEKAANKEDKGAQTLLAKCYYLLGNDKNSFWWLEKAANQGEPEAQYILGLAYYEGAIGVSKNMSKAKEWARKAYEQGYAKASSLLHDIEDEGY